MNSQKNNTFDGSKPKRPHDLSRTTRTMTCVALTFVFGLSLSASASTNGLRVSAYGGCGHHGIPTTIHMVSSHCREMGGQLVNATPWGWGDCIVDMCQEGDLAVAPANACADAPQGRSAYGIITMTGKDCRAIGGAMNGHPADQQWTHCHLKFCEDGPLELGTPNSTTQSAYGIVQTSRSDCEMLEAGMNTNFDWTRHCHLGLFEVKPDPLTETEADAIAHELWSTHAARIRAERAAEMNNRVLTYGGMKMPFTYHRVGHAAFGQRSLYIGMHGGGGCGKACNDDNYEAMKNLYTPSEGIYLAPRAPTDTWNMWFMPHIDQFMDRLIETFVVFEGVDPNRVFIMGYSAGGDGAYRLVPRLADRWAAGAMMAGHPGGVSMDNVRNVPFTIQMGALDTNYNRSGEAARYRRILDALNAGDSEGYTHRVDIYPGLGHALDYRHFSIMPWMHQFSRNLRANRLVWRVDGSNRFYWLFQQKPRAGSRVVVELDGQEIQVIEAHNTDELTFRLDDDMVDLDAPVQVYFNGNLYFDGLVDRSRATMEKTLAERGDPSGVFTAEVTVNFAQGPIQ